MKGRKPKPTMLADLHGRPSKVKAPPHEPKPITGDLFDPPEWLTDSQKAGWQYAIYHAPPGLLKRIDQGVLLVWIAAEDLHRQALIGQAKLGSLLVKSPNVGLLIQSPFLAIINRQGLIMLRASSELGFSPVSRPRIGMIPSLPTPKAELTHGLQAPRRSLDDFLAARPTPATQH